MKVLKPKYSIDTKATIPEFDLIFLLLNDDRTTN